MFIVESGPAGPPHQCHYQQDQPGDQGANGKSQGGPCPSKQIIFHSFQSSSRIRLFSLGQTSSRPQILYSKLFIVMGIPWIFECTHYFAHGNHELAECLSTTEFVLRTIGCINLLRGCLIFFIFVCKESTLDKVGVPLIVWLSQGPSFSFETSAIKEKECTVFFPSSS